MKKIDHFHFHPSAGVVRANVQETLADERTLGSDVDYKLEDLPSEVRSAIETAADRFASFVNLPVVAKAAPVKPAATKRPRKK